MICFDTFDVFIVDAYIINQVIAVDIRLKTTFFMSRG